MRLKPDYVETYVLVGEIHLRRGETEAASRLLGEALQIAPSHPSAHRLLERIEAVR